MSWDDWHEMVRAAYPALWEAKVAASQAAADAAAEGRLTREHAVAVRRATAAWEAAKEAMESHR